MSTASEIAPVTQNRKVLQDIGDYLGPAVLLAFGVALGYYGVTENLFSFAAWGILDLLTGLVLLSSTNPKEKASAKLPIAYFWICVIVVAIIAVNGELVWTWVETACLLGMMIGLTFWRILKNKRFGVIAFCTSLCIASVPIIIGTYQNPQPWEWWLWVGTGSSAAIGFYLSFPWKGGLYAIWDSINAWLFVAVGTAVPVIILILNLRPFF